MIREGHENIKFFRGLEVEHTPAFNKYTLFVVGVQSLEHIAANLNGAEHIYFGANMSFPNPGVNEYEVWVEWTNMIMQCLDKGYTCTLDIDVKSVEGLVECGLTEHHNFIPMISVKLPYLQQLGYNAIIKLDDKDFKATNPGVWCHSLHDLTDRNKFTDWSKYTNDETVYATHN
jgi:hypothetical protein